MAKSLIKSEIISLNELKSLFQKNIFAIPDIQREFVWSKKKIVYFLDSISRHFPIGTFLICKIPVHKARHIREGGALPLFDRRRNKECYLVVDGQQRLSVLYSIIFNESIKTQKYSYELRGDSICLSPSQSKEVKFDYYKENENKYLRLTDMLADRVAPSLNTKRARECKEAFEKYTFPFAFIQGFKEDDMREAFIRLNTGGTPLSPFDKFISMSYSTETDLRTHINDLVEYKLKNGFKYVDRIDMNIFMSVAVNLGVKDFIGTSLTYFSKQLRNSKSTQHKEYKTNHEKVYTAVRNSADFLTDIVKDASYLPYPAMLSILSIFFYANKNKDPNPEQYKGILKWFWITGFGERYSGSVQRENLMNDAKEMRQLAQGECHFSFGNRKNTLSINRLSKIKYTTRSVLRNTFFCYLINKQPIGFNGRPITFGPVSSILNDKNDHHIFPKRLLQNEGYHLEEINRLINICFLTFKDNVHAYKNEPWVYLKEVRNKDYFAKLLSSNMIPSKSCVLSVGDVEEQYASFIKARKELVRNELAKKIGHQNVDMEERL